MLSEASKGQQVIGSRAKNLKDRVEDELCFFTNRAPPVDVAVEIIDAFKEIQRCRPKWLNKLFGRSVEEAEWRDLLLAESDKISYKASAYKEREAKIEERRKKLGIKEPVEELT